MLSLGQCFRTSPSAINPYGHIEGEKDRPQKGVSAAMGDWGQNSRFSAMYETKDRGRVGDKVMHIVIRYVSCRYNRC